MVRSTIWTARSTPAQKPRGPARRMVSGGFFVVDYPFRPGPARARGPFARFRGGIKFMPLKPNCRTGKLGLSAETRVTFVAARSDQTVSHGEFAYFVAVADAQRNILNKKQYTVSFDFVPRQKQLQISDQFAVGLP